jgi:hypothetical protein
MKSSHMTRGFADFGNRLTRPYNFLELWRHSGKSCPDLPPPVLTDKLELILLSLDF